MADLSYSSSNIGVGRVARGKFSLGQTLAATVIVSLAVGPVWVIRYRDRGLPVLFASLPLLLLLAHLARSVRWAKRPPRLCAWALAPLLIRALWDVDLGYSLNVVANLTFGMVGGYLLYTATRLRPSTDFSVIDRGLGIFLVVAAIQVLSRAGGMDLGEFHLLLSVPWGRSNLVAAVLVLAVLLYCARLVVTQPSLVWFAPVIPAALSIVLILSRGALGAVLFGCVIAVQRFGFANISRRSVGKPLLALAVLGLLVSLALLTLSAVSEARQGYGSPTRTVNVRQDLWGIAWNDFVASPIMGSGFGALRGSSTAAVGEASSFAHNFVLSMLQQAGVFGLPILIVLYSQMMRCFKKKQGFMVAFAGALFFLTFVEIVIESPVAGLFAWYGLWHNE